MAVHLDRLCHLCALGRAFARVPCGRERERSQEVSQPAPRADPPRANVQRDKPARVRPGLRVRVQRHRALERESPRGAQPTGLPAGAETRCLERALAVGRAPARPEWSVASDAKGGSGERDGPSTKRSIRPRRLSDHLTGWD
nr:hypothetical protein [Halovivax sp. KZCA124]